MMVCEVERSPHLVHITCVPIPMPVVVYVGVHKELLLPILRDLYHFWVCRVLVIYSTFLASLSTPGGSLGTL